MNDAMARSGNKKRKGVLVKKLQKHLASLPEPTNEYALRMPDLPRDRMLEWKPEELDIEEDAEDAVKRIAKVAKALEDAVLRRRHMAVQKGLPRPLALNVRMGAGDEDDPVKSELRKEMVKMVRYDAHHHPPTGTKKRKNQKVAELEDYGEENIDRAKDLIALEVEKSGALKALKELTPNEIGAAWNQAFKQSMFLPSLKMYGVKSEVNQSEWMEALKQEYELHRARVQESRTKANKLQNKLKILTGGYRSRAGKLQKQFLEAHTELQQLRQDEGCFERLFDQESRAIPYRTAKLEEENAALNENEQRLQAKYARLRAEKEALTQLLAQAAA